MKQIPHRFMILAGVLIATNIIGLIWIRHELMRTSRQVVRLVSVHLSPDEVSPDRLTLLFDRNMVQQESMGRTEPVQLFELEPVWPGSWQWSRPDTLEYMLDKPLPPGRVFRLHPTGRFRTRTGKVLEGNNDFRVETVALKLEECTVLTVDNHDVTLEMGFNQPVGPLDLLHHTRFYDDRSSRDMGNVVCLTKMAEEKIVVRVSRPDSNRIKIVVGEQLAGYGAQLSLGSKVERTLEISSVFSLLSIHALQTCLEDTVAINLQFSQQLNTQQEIPNISVEPLVETLKVHRDYKTLVVSGKFVPGSNYTIKVPGTLLDNDNHALGKEQSATVIIPDREPSIQFAHKWGFLSPLGNLTLDIKATNVEGIELKSWRIYQNNLIPHLHGAELDETSRFLRHKTVKFDTSYNEVQKLAVELQDLIEGGNGIYHIQARATNRRWTSDWAVVNITDLAITAKSERDGLLVWVTSLRTGKPVSGVQVTAITSNNQTLAKAETDAVGIARLKYISTGPDGKMWVITAQKDGDLSYLQASDNQWMIDDVEQSGRAYARHYEVMLYPERGVYRPGDTIYLTGILRQTTGETPPAFPLAVNVIRPDGRQISELLVKPEENHQGMFQTDFSTRLDGQTGCYRFQVTLPGLKEVLGSTEVFVEAFVPLRMEVKAEPTAERFGPDEPPMMEISAKYLWDQPAARLPLKVEGVLRTVAFKSGEFPNFHFGTGQKSKQLLIPDTAGQLDGNGKAKIAIQLPKLPAAGIYQLDFSATVTESGGRSVSSNSSAILDELDHHIGLRLRDGEVVAVDKPTAADWVSLTGEGKQVPAGKMEMRLVSVEYDTVLKEIDGRQVWESVEKTDEIKMLQLDSAPDTKGSFEITCPRAGKYRVIIEDKKTSSVTSLDFYASEENSMSQTLVMNRPERLEIVTDRQTYLPGETVQVLVRSSFSGTLLLTVETDRVVDFRTSDVNQNTVELRVPLPKELRGCAYLTGTVIRPVDPNQNNWLPHRAMGMARVLLDHTSRMMPVSISAPKKMQPGQSAMVTIETGPSTDPNQPSFVHFWAVDEGILLTSAYQTPYPMSFFLGPRRLGVSTSDIFFQLLPDFERPTGITRIGADGAGENAVSVLRRNPVPSRQRQAAVVWQKIVAVDPNGKVTVEINMPDLIGQMRLMAVAVDHDRYGRAEHNLTLTAPLIVEASWPRFVAPDDAFQVPVKLFNSANRPLSLRFRTDVNGPIEISSDSFAEEIILRPGEPVVHLLNAKAIAIGQVEVQVEAEETKAADQPLKAVNKACLTVRPATALHSEVQLKNITAGEELKLEPSKSFTEGTVRMTVAISPRPTIQLKAALERLIDYPYGCVEQTTSRLFALLYAADIIGDGNTGAINSMVQAGIARLWSMQTLSGGISYWPGGTDASEWGTAYAAWCLMEAQNAGHKVDPRFSKELIKYLNNRLGADNEGENTLNTKALFCRVLSTFGQPSHGWMNLLAERKGKLDAAALAHLAGAFHAAGNKEKAMALLAEQLPSTSVETTTSGLLTSQIQQEAVLLSVLLEIDPNHPMVAPLAESLVKTRQNGCWGSTLENAAAIVALSRYQTVTSNEKSEYKGSIQADNAQIINFDHTQPVSHEFTNVSRPVVISSSGSGKIYITVTMEGLAVKGVVQPYNRQMSTQRRWVDREGKAIDPNSLHVGDLVHVEIEVNSPSNRIVNNVAIVDALPGGMEVENPRLATSIHTDQQSENQPDHMEFLDDRVVLFCSIGNEPRVFKYALRATTAGSFELPPIQASCMYNPAIASLHKGGGVVIRP